LNQLVDMTFKEALSNELLQKIKCTTWKSSIYSPIFYEQFI